MTKPEILGKPGAHSYDASSITVLETASGAGTPRHVMVGDTGSNGLHQLVYEVVENPCIDEAMAG